MCSVNCSLQGVKEHSRNAKQFSEGAQQICTLTFSGGSPEAAGAVGRNIANRGCKGADFWLAEREAEREKEKEIEGEGEREEASQLPVSIHVQTVSGPRQ